MTTQTQISRPAPFIEDIGKDFAKSLIGVTGLPALAADISGQLTKAQMSKINIDNEIKQQAAKNLLESVKQAQTEYNQIVAEESKDLTEYRNKISDILKEIPTFENRADSLVDLDPVRLRAKLVDLQNDGTLSTTAATPIVEAGKAISATKLLVKT